MVTVQTKMNKEINVYSVSRFTDSNGERWTLTGTIDYKAFGIFFNLVNAEGTEKQVTADYIESGYDHE